MEDPRWSNRPTCNNDVDQKEKRKGTFNFLLHQPLVVKYRFSHEWSIDYYVLERLQLILPTISCYYQIFLRKACQYNDLSNWSTGMRIVSSRAETKSKFVPMLSIFHTSKYEWTNQRIYTIIPKSQLHPHHRYILLCWDLTLWTFRCIQRKNASIASLVWRWSYSRTNLILLWGKSYKVLSAGLPASIFID